MFDNFDKGAKWKAFYDAYKCGGWLIFQDLLHKRVAEGVASDPPDFN